MKPVAPPKNVNGRIARARATHPASLREKAYEAIKQRIITCALKPGEYVNELQLSAVLAIGRTPVHQALKRLTLEGMVEIIPHKGAIVRPFRLNEVLQIAEARIVNEIHCARLAAERASNLNIAALEDTLAQTRHWAPLRNVEKLVLLDRAFHGEPASAAQNDALAQLLRGLHERSLRFWSSLAAGRISTITCAGSMKPSLLQCASAIQKPPRPPCAPTWSRFSRTSPRCCDGLAEAACDQRNASTP